MNLKNLTEEVFALGFEEGGEVTDGFYSCVNRALRLIFSEYPTEKRLRTFVNSPTPISRVPLYTHRGNTEYALELSGKAVSFIASGDGEALLRDGSGERLIRFCSNYFPIKEFVSGRGEIIFRGPYSYTVSDIAQYGEILSSAEEDIPLAGDNLILPIEDYAKDFLSFSRLPEDGEGRIIDGAKISGNTLCIPQGFTGEIRIYYNRLPTEITKDNEEAVIDIPESCSHLLPLLAASYLWLEDEPERAAYYLQLYRDGMARVKQLASPTLDTGFSDVLRWA